MKDKPRQNPYPGLRPFEFYENHLFFGREGQSEEVLRRLGESHFVAVVGTSGSGKSSLVRAGLLPLLHGGGMLDAGSRWRVALFRPGDDPIHNLSVGLTQPLQLVPQKTMDPRTLGAGSDLAQDITETLLRRSAVGLRDYANSQEFAEDENLLIVVDQFEELFRFKKESQSGLLSERSPGQEKAENEAAAFVKLLLESARDTSNRVYVVITMRSDFLGDCSQFRDLPEAINGGQYLIPRLTSEQLKKAIESPAKVKRARIQPALVARLLNDIGDDQDQLPVLQHALMRTWDKWEQAGDPRSEITFDHYNATGGMATALSEHANEAYDELGNGDQDTVTPRQEIAQKVFRCLTETDRENRETRRATSLGKICGVAGADLDEVAVVINTFRKPGRTFLMPPFEESLTPDTVIDISHESLIRKWDKLRKWVADEALASQQYRRLAEDALLNKALEKGFWGDPELAKALLWRDTFKPNETWASLYDARGGSRSTFGEAMQYLDASRADRNRKARRSKLLTGALVALTLVSLLTTVFAFALYFQAKASAKDAVAQREEAVKQKAEADVQRSLAEVAAMVAEKEKVNAEEQRDLARKATRSEQEKAVALTLQTKLAEFQTRKAKASEAEKQLALAEQTRLTQRAEDEKLIAQKAKADADKATTDALIARGKAIATAEREELNRDALTLLEQGENKQALPKFEQLFKSYLFEEQRSRKPDVNGKWWALHNLGIVHSRINRASPEAVTAYKCALSLLGETADETEECGANGTLSQRAPFMRNASFENPNEINIRKVTTLRRLAQFYRAQAEDGVDEVATREANLLAVKKYLRLRAILRLEPDNAKSPKYPADVSVELADTYAAINDGDLYGLDVREYELENTNTYDKARTLYDDAIASHMADDNLVVAVEILKKKSDLAVIRQKGSEAVVALQFAIKIQENMLRLPPLNLDLADSYYMLEKANKSVLVVDGPYYAELSDKIYDLDFAVNKTRLFNAEGFRGLATAYKGAGNCDRAALVYLYAADKAVGMSESIRAENARKISIDAASFFEFSKKDITLAGKMADQAAEETMRLSTDHFVILSKTHDQSAVARDAALREYRGMLTYLYPGNYYYRNAKYDNSLAQYYKVLSLVREASDRIRKFGNSDRTSFYALFEVNLMLKIGDVLEKQGKTAEAGAIYKEAVAFAEKEKGRDEVLSEAKLGLAGYYLRQGRQDVSRQLYEEVLKVWEAVAAQRQSSPKREYVWYYVAAQQQLGKFDEPTDPIRARGRYERSIAMMDKLIGTRVIVIEDYGKYGLHNLFKSYFGDRADILESWSKLSSGEEAEKRKDAADAARGKYEQMDEREKSIAAEQCAEAR